MIRGAGGTFCPGAERGHLDEMAWEALPSEQVEERAAELACRAARPAAGQEGHGGPAHRARAAPAAVAAALEVERGAPLWSPRRRVR